MKKEIVMTKGQKLSIDYAIKANQIKIVKELPFAVKDVDLTKRIVTGMFNTYYYFDGDYDVLITGAAKKSISERGAESDAMAKIKHALFHNLTRLPGKIQVISEREVNGLYGIYFETKMSETTEGNDTLINYQEGVYDNHSIGFLYKQLEYIEAGTDEWDHYLQMLINPEAAEAVGYMWIVKEINLFEGSTVSFGSNQLTPYLGVKSANKSHLRLKIGERIDLLGKQLRAGKQSDEQMNLFDLQLRQLKQIINEFSINEPSLKDTIVSDCKLKQQSLLKDTQRSCEQIMEYVTENW